MSIICNSELAMQSEFREATGLVIVLQMSLMFMINFTEAPACARPYRINSSVNSGSCSEGLAGCNLNFNAWDGMGWGCIFCGEGLVLNQGITFNHMD